MVADGLTLSSGTVGDIQDLVTECKMDASREYFSFSKTKTMALCSKCKDIPDPDVLLYNTNIKMSSAEMHLGIMRSYGNSNKTTIAEQRKCG